MIKVKPLSPHLSIYKPQVTSVFSILHRITGVYLYVFLLFISGFLLLFNKSMMVFMESLEHTPFVKYLLVMSIVTFICCLSYHLCTGIRYILWSFNLCFNMSNVKISAFAVAICTFLLSFTSTYLFLT